MVMKSIVLDDLRVGYGEPLIDKVSYTFTSPAIFCLVGLNGSGKSTLMKTLCGIIQPVSGQVLVNGTPPTIINPRMRAREVCFLPAAHERPSDMLVEEYVTLGRLPWKSPLHAFNVEDRNIAKEMAINFGVANWWEKPVNKLSDGEFRRVVLARAMTQNASYYLMDEPFVNLDWKSIKEICNLLVSFVQKNKLFLMVSTHDARVHKLLGGELLLVDDRKLLRLDALSALPGNNLLEDLGL